VNPKKKIYILDSFALLAYLGDETGRERLEQLLKKADDGSCTLQMCMINFGEVLYITERHRGLMKAQKVQATIEALPIEIIDVSRNLILDAAHIKANYAISYADAFVAALAKRGNGIIITGDPEFELVEKLVLVEWLNR
jgi:predicted nucleic acid-binding protein